MRPRGGEGVMAKRIAVTVDDRDLDHVKRYMNPKQWPLAAVLGSIIREVVKDDRETHIVRASKKPDAMARR
jgi:hypothetical protein